MTPRRSSVSKRQGLSDAAPAFVHRVTRGDKKMPDTYIAPEVVNQTKRGAKKRSTVPLPTAPEMARFFAKTDPIQRLHAAYKEATADLDQPSKGCDDASCKQLEEAYHKAQDQFVAAPTTSLVGVLLKLQFVSDAGEAGNTLDPIDKRILSGLMQDLKAIQSEAAQCALEKGAQSLADSARASFKPTASPMALAEAIAAAVFQLWDAEGNKPRPGVGIPELVAALSPIMGEYTVADAVLMEQQLNLAEYVSYSIPEWNKQDMGSALCHVKYMLRDFVCCADASTAACRIARAHFYIDENGGSRGRALSPANKKLIADALAGDLLWATSSEPGHLFCGRDSHADSAFVEEPWWIHRQKSLKGAGLAPD